MPQNLTHGALFAGLLGFGLAAQWAGIETTWYSEINDFCNEHNAINFPHAIQYGDIRELSGRNMPKVNIISGGFPCQDVSVGGKGEGVSGARSGLWWHQCRLLGEIRPDYAIFENSPLLAVRGLDRVLCGLAEVGYDAVWDCVRASDYGAPHLRERLYLIAYPNKFGLDKVPAWPQRDSETRQKAPGFWQGAGGHTPDRLGHDAWGTAVSEFRRVDDGLSRELVKEEFAAYGNAVVPQIPQEIFEAIKLCY